MRTSLALAAQLSTCVVRRTCRHPSALPPGRRAWSSQPRRRCVASATADDFVGDGGQARTRTSEEPPPATPTPKSNKTRDLQQSYDLIRAIICDPTQLVKAVASGKAKGHDPSWRRVEMRPVLLKKGGVKLQVVKYDERQAFTSNHNYDILATESGRANGRNTNRGRSSEGSGKNNLSAAEVTSEAFGEGFGNWRVETLETVVQIKVLKNDLAQVHETKALLSNAKGPGGKKTTLVTPGGEGSNITDHDREKPRLLSPDDPFLIAVGVSSKDGKSIKANRRDKYKQVEEFVKLVEFAVSDAVSSGSNELNWPTETRPVRLVDLGCGNAYLTFGAYAHLTRAHLKNVDDEKSEKNDAQKKKNQIFMEVVGVDVKRQSRETNSRVAVDMGWENNCVFVEGTIAEAEVTFPTPRAEDGGNASRNNPSSASVVDVVLALHACDTATDEALVRAVKWRAPLTLVAPCCHHDLQVRLKEHTKRTENGVQTSHNGQGPLMKHGILRERMGDVLTDAFRAHVMRLLGHRVDVTEWIGGEHTPRNTMIKAVRTGGGASKQTWREYDAMVAEWGVTPRLAEMLRDELAEARAAAFSETTIV